MEADLLTVTLDLAAIRADILHLTGLIGYTAACFWLGFWVGRATREG